MDKRRAFLQIRCMPIEDLARPHRKRQSMMIGVFGTSPEFHQADEVDEKFLRSLDREGGNEEGYPVGFTESVQNSKALDRLHEFHIVIAASGMCEAGRIRHRLKTLLWRDEATVFTVGFVDLACARAKLDDAFDLRRARVIQSIDSGGWSLRESGKLGHNDVSRPMLDINDAIDKDADDRARAVRVSASP